MVVLTSHVTGSPSCFARRTRSTAPAVERRQTNSCARGTYQLEDGSQRDRLGEGRNARQPEPRGDLAIVRHAAFREIGVLGAQPHCIAERGVLQRAPQDLSASGAFACENATHPASESCPISVRRSPRA